MNRLEVRLHVRHLLGIALASAAITLSGCNDGPELAEVHGTVRLGGKPVAGVLVEFNPIQGESSYGTTNQRGEYTLRFDRHRAGAELGQHKVRITADDDSRVRVPEKYNEETTLTATVNPGVNQIDFDLEAN